MGDEGTDDLENDISVASRTIRRDCRFHGLLSWNVMHRQGQLAETAGGLLSVCGFKQEARSFGACFSIFLVSLGRSGSELCPLSRHE